MQSCSSCRLLKKLQEFNFRNIELGIRQRECKVCISQRNKSHYRTNLQYYKSKAKDYHKMVVQKNRLIICDYLVNHPCIDCGEKDITVLEFDHRYDKDRAVSLMLRFSRNRLFAEIEKCDVRCANCHR